MKTKNKKPDRHRSPRVAVQLPKETAEAGKQLAAADGKTFGGWLADKIEASRRKLKR